MDNDISLRFLGTVQLEREHKPISGLRSRKALALLAYLAAQDQPVPREQLAELFWEGQPAPTGLANLSWALNRLCALLPSVLHADRHTVQITHEPDCWLDTRAFETLTSSQQSGALADAMALYRGEYLEGFEVEGCSDFSVWLVGERERWRQRAARVLDALVSQHSQRGEYDSSLDYARKLLLLEPWREETHRLVMRLLVRVGSRSAALAQYDACRQTLERELSVQPARETTALYERIRTADVLRYNHLPSQPTPFLGRQAELAQVLGILDQRDCRLLTITGPGGIGKTRLAVQAGAARQNAYLEGVCFVSLAGVNADFMQSAIADALRCAFTGARALQNQLVDFLCDKELLLVLDSMEHLLEHTAVLVEILEEAPEVQLLVTSREKLNLRWERCFELEGLDYETGSTPNGNPVQQCSAAQLFEQTARRAHPHFAPSANDRAHIARVCQLVEGMPLGIELAAAWVTTRTCAEIADEISHNLNLLTTTWRDVPERHRSMRASFERSWRLLSSTQQRALACLSVMQGSFCADDAQAISGVSSDQLRSLADKSLLHSLPAQRYEMHELVRQFAAEKLSALPDVLNETRDSHCEHFASFLSAQENRLCSLQAAQAIADIRAQILNVRAAWRWAVDRARYADIRRSVNSLARYYLLVGPYQEGVEAMRLALDNVTDLPADSEWSALDTQALRGCLLAEQARLQNARGRFAEAARAATEAAACGDSAGQPDLHALGLLLWAQALWQQREYESARALAEQALSLAQSAHDDAVLADSLYQLGLIHWHLGHFGDARLRFDHALRLYCETGDWKGESSVLGSYGSLCGYEGDCAQASGYFQRALDILRQAGDSKGECMTLVNLDWRLTCRAISQLPCCTTGRGWR